MLSLLHQYFAKHHKVALPGIGSFMVVQQPAAADFVNKLVQGPAYNIVFQPDTAASDDGFCAFIAQHSGMAVQESMDAVTDFARSAEARLQSGEQLQLPGIGILAAVNGRYAFTPDDAVQRLFPPVSAEKAVRQNASHTILVGEAEKTSEQMQELLQQAPATERWWITAIVLAVIAIAIIALYHGSR